METINAAAAFKAIAPETVTAWHDRRDADMDDFTERCQAFAHRYGRDDLVYNSIGFADAYRAGAIGFESGGEVPEGWRRDSRSKLVVPAKRTEAGKAAAKELEDLRYQSYAPGLPKVAHNVRDPHTGAGLMGGFAIRLLGDDWYATLSFVPDQRTVDAVDSGLWERVRMSEFYAAVENQEAAAAS